MELLYFIGGILTVGLIYGGWFFRQIHKEHQNLLSQNRVLDENQDKIMWEMSVVKARVEGVNNQNIELTDKINTSTFESTMELKKRMDVMDILMNTLHEQINTSNRVNEKSMTKVFNDYQQLRGNVKSLREDPNFLSRY